MPGILQSSIGGIPIDCCIYNASGPRTGSIEALAKIAASKAGAVLSKSSTLVKQAGNDMPRFVNKIDLGEGHCLGSMNSEGLPNSGIDYYVSEEAVETLKPFQKPYIVSLSGLSLADNLEMLERAMNTEGVAAVELNLACPNIPGKPIIAYDFEQMEKVLLAVCLHRSFDKKPLGVKLAPYFDAPHFEQAAILISKFPIKFIVCINTIGNALIVDSESECTAMAAKGGYGGLGGGFVKPTALANVHTMCRLLSEKKRGDIDVIGVGGICSGRDAFEMILCGAKAVQVGTCHWNEGPACFDRISAELEAIMQSKGYKSIEEFRGKLKPYSKDAAKKMIGQSSTGKLSTSENPGGVSSFKENLPYICLHVLLVFLCISISYCVRHDLHPFAL